MAQDRFEAALHRAIVKRRAETPEQREQIYAAARESFQRTGRATEELDALGAAIKSVEDTFSKPSRKTAPRWTEILNPWMAPVFLAGIAAGLGATYLLSITPAGTNDIDDAVFAQRHVERTYKENADLMPAAIGYLREVTDAIVARQRNDRATLAKSEKTFVGLATFDAQLAQKIPAALPRGTSVIVRANATDFKVLMNWTLCGVAAISNPEMIDKVRTTVTTVGCPYFGLWTTDAARW